MSKVIRRLRLLRPHHRPNDVGKKGKIRIPILERCVRGVVEEILHERGRVAPLARIRIEGTDGPQKELLVAVEGCYVGQAVEMGDGVPVSPGNAVRIRSVPEGVDVCAVERKPKDGGKMAVSSGSYVTIVAHNAVAGTTMVKLPSGEKKSVSSDCMCVVGVVAGGGVNEKPILKASRAFYRAKSRGHYWPRVRGVAMNPVDHPHGGGNHQHVGHPTTISVHAPPGQKVGLVGARRTGLRRGSKKVLDK